MTSLIVASCLINSPFSQLAGHVPVKVVAVQQSLATVGALRLRQNGVGWYLKPGSAKVSGMDSQVYRDPVYRAKHAVERNLLP